MEWEKYRLQYVWNNSQEYFNIWNVQQRRLGTRSQEMWLQIFWSSIGELERQNLDKIINNLGKKRSRIYIIN